MEDQWAPSFWSIFYSQKESWSQEERKTTRLYIILIHHKYCIAATVQNRAEYNVSAARAKAALTLGVLVFSPNSDRRISSCSFSGRESEFISLSATQVSESRLPAQGFAIDARAAQVTNHSDAGCDAVAALRHALKSGYFPEELYRRMQMFKSVALDIF